MQTELTTCDSRDLTPLSIMAFSNGIDLKSQFPRETCNNPSKS